MNTKESHTKPILFFTNFPPPFTGHTVLNRMFFNFAKNRFSTCDLINISRTGGDLKTTGKFRLGGIFFYVLKLIELNRVLRTNDVRTLVLTFSHSPLGFIKNLLAVVIARRKVKNIVGHIHTGIYHTTFQKAILRPLYFVFIRKVNVFIFNSSRLYQLTEKFIPEEKSFILENTIDNELLFERQQVDKKIESRRQSHRLEILYISNMIPSKGYMDLAIALSLLSKTTKLDFHARFIGGWTSNREHREFINYVKKEGLDQRVSIHGSISERSLISNYLLSSHIFVLPTYYPTECQPVSIIEAMNAGNAIISTRHASIPEYVFDNVNGILVDSKAPQQICNAIIAFQDVDFWQKCAFEARKTFDEKFHPEIIRLKYLNFLERAT